MQQQGKERRRRRQKGEMWGVLEKLKINRERKLESLRPISVSDGDYMIKKIMMMKLCIFF